MSQNLPPNDTFTHKKDDDFDNLLNTDANTNAHLTKLDDLPVLEQSSSQDVIDLEQLSSEILTQENSQKNDISYQEVPDSYSSAHANNSANGSTSQDTPSITPVSTNLKKRPFSFGKKSNKITPSNITATHRLKAKPKPTNSKNIWLVLAGVLALLLLFGAWLLSKNTTPTTVAEPVAVQQDMPVAPVETQPVASQEIVQESTAEHPIDMPLAEHNKVIDADAIIKAEIPKDPTLIKEEIDRLSDKNGQFKDQAQMIDEQLGKLEELTVAKEEQIALLEAQIAQLESQKKP